MKKITTLLIIIMSLVCMSAHAVPGQDIENAILLVEGQSQSFQTSVNQNGNNVIYFKMQAEFDGTMTMHLDKATSYARWMEEGIVAYGTLRQNLFRDGKSFDVQKGHVYYATFTFEQPTSGTLFYTFEAAPEGATRSMAYVVSAEGKQELRGAEPQYIDGDLIYSNTVTWFRLDSEALAGYDIVSVAIEGGNETSVSIHMGEDASLLKTYMMGGGSAMLPFDSTIQFDADLASHVYYVSITQDNTGGSATFSFAKSSPGDTPSSALEAVWGQNVAADPVKSLWYRYTHQGEDGIIAISGGGVDAICDVWGKVLVGGTEVQTAFRVRKGDVLYFKATGDFVIGKAELEPGLSPDNPLRLELVDGMGSFGFVLNGATSADVCRYVSFEAQEDGTLMYGTTHKKVIELANGSTVRDLTTGRLIPVVQELMALDENYYTYTCEVERGHSYLVEQTLQDDCGAVNFLVVFTPAKEGESVNKPYTLTLGKPLDLGRKKSLAKYLRFTAPEDGDYLLSMHVTGQVRMLGDDAHNVSKDYVHGTDFHNEVVALQRGETVLLSVTPSADIEHIQAGQAAAQMMQDYFIPNYYAVVSPVASPDSATPAQVRGLDASSPIAIEGGELTVADTNQWYSVEVPAGQTFTVSVSGYGLDAETAAVFFANTDVQWIDRESEISKSLRDGALLYVLVPVPEPRTILLMTNGISATSARLKCWVGDEETSIKPLLSTASNASYSLSGLPVKSNHKSAIHVVNGRKVVVR